MSKTNDATLIRLPLGTADTKKVLWTGEVRGEHVPKKVLLVDADDQVVFRVAEGETFPNGISKWAITFRLYSLSATAMACLTTFIYGVSQPDWTTFRLRAALAFFGTVLLQIAINVLNDVEDHLRLIDLPNQNGGSGALQKGWISARSLYFLGICFAVAAAIAGLPALIAEPRLLIAPTVAAAVGVMGYSGWPFGFKYRALGDVAVFFLCGPLLTQAYSIASFGNSNASVLWLGVAMGMAAVGILHANNLQDIPIDSRRGARTLATAFGFKRARYGLAVCYVTALSALIVFGFQSRDWITPVLGLLALPLMIGLSRKSIRAESPESPLLNQTRVEAAKIHMTLGLLISLGLGIHFYFMS